MKLNTILYYFLYLLLFMSVAILIIGTFETMRIEFFFPIVEDNLLIAGQTPAHIYNEYLNTKGLYIFTNEPFIDIMNFVGLIGIFGIFFFAWRMGRKSLPFKLNEILNTYSLLFILFFYFVIVIFNYIVDIFVSQLIQLLFNDILIAIYMYAILVDYFPFLVLGAIFVSYMSNQIKYFDILRN